MYAVLFTLSYVRQHLPRRLYRGRAVAGGSLTGDLNFGGQIEQRFQHERALVQSRMRQRQRRALNNHFAEQQQIQIDVARCIFLLPLAAALAAEHQLDIEQVQQQPIRLERCFKLCHGINEVGAPGCIDRCRFVKRGNRQQLGLFERAQRVERRLQRFDHFTLIGAQPDVCGSFHSDP